MVYQTKKGWMRTGSDKIYSSEKRAAYAERRSQEGKKVYKEYQYRDYDNGKLKISYDEIYGKMIKRRDVPQKSDPTKKDGTPEGRGFLKILKSYDWDKFTISLKDLVEMSNADDDMKGLLKTIAKSSESISIRYILRDLGF